MAGTGSGRGGGDEVVLEVDLVEGCAFDLLAPFDRRWKAVFAALLAADPAERFAMPFCVAARRPCLWPLAGMVASAAVASVLTALCVRFRQPSAQEPTCVSAKDDVSVEAVFSIPDSVK